MSAFYFYCCRSLHVYTVRAWNFYFKLKQTPLLFSERNRIKCRVLTLGKWHLVVGKL